MTVGNIPITGSLVGPFSGGGRLVELPVYLMDAGDPILLEGFEDHTDWTVSTGSAATNTTQFKQGLASVKQTSPSGGAGQIQRDATFNLSFYVAFRRMVYAHDAEISYSALWWFQGGNYYLKSDNFPPVGRWQAYNTLRSDFVDGGTPPNWDSNFTRLRMWAVPTALITELSHDRLTGLQGLPKPAVLLMFDDAHTTQYDVAFQYMAPRNIRGTCCVPSDLVGGAGACTWDELGQMYAHGWDLANHSTDATDFTTLTQAQIETRLTACKTELDNRGYTRASNHVAYPSGAVDADVIAAMTALSMKTGRLAGGNNMFLPWGDNYYLPVRGVSNTTTLATATGWVDTAIARGEVLIIMIHYLVASPSIATEWHIDRFQGLIDYIVSKSRANEIYPITISELYALQSGSAKVSVP